MANHHGPTWLGWWVYVPLIWDWHSLSPQQTCGPTSESRPATKHKALLSKAFAIPRSQETENLVLSGVLNRVLAGLLLQSLLWRLNPWNPPLFGHRLSSALDTDWAAQSSWVTSADDFQIDHFSWPSFLGERDPQLVEKSSGIHILFRYILGLKILCQKKRTYTGTAVRASIFPCLRKVLQTFQVPQLTLCWSLLSLQLQA